MRANDEATLGIYAEIRKSRYQIFDFKYNDVANNITQGFYRNGYQQKLLDSFFRSNPPLLSYDKMLFNQYVELVRSRVMHANVNYADS